MNPKPNKQWHVKSKGKLERIIIFYVGLIVVVVGYIIASGTLRRNPIPSDESFLGPIILLSIFGIPVFLGTIGRLFKSKVPIGVGLDFEHEIFRIAYSKKNIQDIPFNELGYAKVGEHSSHFALTIYKTYIGTRGQLVFNKVIELIGMPLTFSWKKWQIAEICSELERLNINQTKAKNADLPLWERIISN